MKIKLLLLLMLLAFSSSVFSQNKVVKYCEVAVFGYNDQNLKTKINTGLVDSLFSLQNSKLKDELQKVSSLKTVPDVLNYMGLIGWSLCSNTASGTGGAVKYFYFQKEFDPSELTTTNNH